MRFARFAFLGFAALMLTVSVARADTSTSPRNFGTTACRQQFACTTGADQLSLIANDCSVQGLGIATVQTGIFDGAFLDGSNCMTGKLPSAADSTSSSTMYPKCCITSNGDTCGMYCTLLVY